MESAAHPFMSMETALLYPEEPNFVWDDCSVFINEAKPECLIEVQTGRLRTCNLEVDVVQNASTRASRKFDKAPVRVTGDSDTTVTPHEDNLRGRSRTISLPMEKPLINAALSPDWMLLALQFTPNEVWVAGFDGGHVQGADDSADLTVGTKGVKLRTNVQGGHNARILGFLWTFVNELVIITDRSVELFQIIVQGDGRKKALPTKSYSLSVSWYRYSAERHVLMICGNPDGSLFVPIQFNCGTCHRLMKFNVKPTVNRFGTAKPRAPMMFSAGLSSVCNIYGQLLGVFVVPIGREEQTAEMKSSRMSPNADEWPVNLMVYKITQVQSQQILNFPLPITKVRSLCIMDNLVIVHGQHASMAIDLFDVLYSGQLTSALKLCSDVTSLQQSTTHDAQSGIAKPFINANTTVEAILDHALNTPENVVEPLKHNTPILMGPAPVFMTHARGSLAGLVTPLKQGDMDASFMSSHIPHIQHYAFLGHAAALAASEGHFAWFELDLWAAEFYVVDPLQVVAFHMRRRKGRPILRAYLLQQMKDVVHLNNPDHLDDLSAILRLVLAAPADKASSRESSDLRSTDSEVTPMSLTRGSSAAHWEQGTTSRLGLLRRRATQYMTARGVNPGWQSSPLDLILVYVRGLDLDSIILDVVLPASRVISKVEEDEYDYDAVWLVLMCSTVMETSLLVNDGAGCHVSQETMAKVRRLLHKVDKDDIALQLAAMLPTQSDTTEINRYRREALQSVFNKLSVDTLISGDVPSEQLLTWTQAQFRQAQDENDEKRMRDIIGFVEKSGLTDRAREIYNTEALQCLRDMHHELKAMQMQH
eukprot:Clim_evm40s243 gene=Clim_evmTU40s243